MPERSYLFGPLLVEYGRVERVSLAGPGVDRCLSFEPPPFTWCGLAAHGLVKAVELGVDPPTDVGSAAGELGEDLVTDIADLGDPVLGDVPADTEAVGQLATQSCVVHRRQRLLVVLDESRVERKPATVGRLHAVRDHQVGVQLWVEPAAGVLSEGGGHDALRIDDRHVAADAVASVGMPFDPARERRDRGVVSGEDFVSGVEVTEREQHRYRLRCRAGDVEAAHRLVVVAATEVTVRACRVEPAHERDEGVVVDLAAEAEELCPVAEPDASWFTGLEVVVRQLLDVVGAGVGALESGHADGHRELPGASVHSSIHEVPWVRVGLNCGGIAAYTEKRRAVHRRAVDDVWCLVPCALEVLPRSRWSTGAAR